MPLRQRPDLWANLPGVVAAYQPVRAPGPLLARYNMAHGGDNRYRATDGTPPTWSGALGWQFSAASLQYLTTGFAPDGQTTGLIRYRDYVATGSGTILFGGSGTSSTRFYFYPQRNTGDTRFAFGWAGAQVLTNPAGLTTAVAGLAGATAYVNGAVATTVSSTWTGTSTPLFVGAWSNNGTAALHATGTVMAVLICARVLSAAEAWSASRQMAYCDVNPEWSVWARQRQWYYGAQPGSFQAAWARNANSVLQVGRQ